MSSVDMTLVEQARAIERPLPVPGASGLYGLELNDQSYQVSDAQLREIRKRFAGEVSHGLNKVQAKVTGGMYGHADMAKLRDDQFIVSRLSEMMPSGKALLAAALLPGVGTTYLAYDIEKVRRERAFPDELMWVAPSELLGRGRKDVRNGQLGNAAADLGAAEASAAKAVAALSKYREGVIEGAGSAIDTLEVTRDVSFATVGILATVVTGGSILGAAAIASGVTATGTVAQQAMEVSLDMRKEIDWKRISFDAVVGFVTTLIGAKFGSAAAGWLLKTPVGKLAAQKFGSKAAEALAALINDAVMGELLGAAQTVASEVYEAAAGEKAPLTFEQYGARVVERLLDPTAFFMNLLQGEITRRLHVAMPPKASGGHGEPGPRQLTEKTTPRLGEKAAPQLEQKAAAPELEQMHEPVATAEPTPQLGDPAAQQSVEPPAVAGTSEVLQSTAEPTPQVSEPAAKVSEPAAKAQSAEPAALEGTANVLESKQVSAVPEQTPVAAAPEGQTAATAATPPKAAAKPKPATKPAKKGTKKGTKTPAQARLEELRQKEPVRGSAGEGWDQEQFPKGADKNWKVGDPIDMPSKKGAAPDYDSQRVWKNAADVELRLREAGKASQEPAHPVADAVEPLRSLTDAQLETLRRTGTPSSVGLEGFEIEHQFIPQRAAKMFEDAGIPADESLRLAHVADPANLDPMHKSLHAVSDRQALNQTTRNPELKASVEAEKGTVRPSPDAKAESLLREAILRGDEQEVARLSKPFDVPAVLDDRTLEAPLRSMTPSQFEALEAAVKKYDIAKKAATDPDAKRLLDAMADWRARWRNGR